MAIELISKIKPKNNGTFKLVDVEDIEYNGKSLAEAITSGEFKGEKGDAGATGPAGKDGAQGPAGKQGEVGPTGPAGAKGDKGEKGDKGDPFSIAKTFPSVKAMNDGFATDGVKEGQFVMIDTGNVEDADNAKLYVKGAAAYSYITDLSGATGLTGPAGAKGETGAQGPKGEAGAKGADGETPNFEIRDGHLIAIYGN